MAEVKQIKIHTEFITLQQALKLAKIIDGGGQAKDFILKNPIYVNSVLETRRGRKLYNGFSLKVNDESFVICNENWTSHTI